SLRIHSGASLVVTAVVENHHDDRNIVARHRPERFTLTEKKATVSLQTDHLVIGPGELDADRCANSPSQRVSGRSPYLRLLALCKGEPLERPRTLRTEFFDDVSIAIQCRIDLVRKAFPR